MRIGVISDNHSRTADGGDLPASVLEVFSGADLIVHCGDAGSWGTLDRLEAVAPVVGVLAKNGQNGTGEDKRIEGDRRIIRADGLRIGIVHDLVTQGVTTESHPGLVSAQGELGAAIRALFGEAIDVLLWGGTHAASISYVSGMLMVNPGSPTLPADHSPDARGTVAVVDVDGGIARPKIVDVGGSLRSTGNRPM